MEDLEIPSRSRMLETREGGFGRIYMKIQSVVSRNLEKR